MHGYPIKKDLLDYDELWFMQSNFPFLKTPLLFSHCDMGVTWPGPASTIRSHPNLCLTPLSTTFCHVGHILVVDQSRPVPPVPPCPVDEDGNSHSFHPRGKTEVSQLVVFYLYYRFAVCEEKLRCLLSEDIVIVVPMCVFVQYLIMT